MVYMGGKGLDHPPCQCKKGGGCCAEFGSNKELECHCLTNFVFSDTFTSKRHRRERDGGRGGGGDGGSSSKGGTERRAGAQRPVLREDGRLSDYALGLESLILSECGPGCRL